MKLFFVLICIWLAKPGKLCSHESQQPNWRIYGEVAVGLVQSQSDSAQFFIRQCYRGKTLSAAFGINFHFGNLTSGHLTGLRQLLLISGDVECNPGPGNEETYSCGTCEKTFDTKRIRNEHEKHVHGEKNFSCETCDYSTSKASHYKRHVETHEKPSNSRATQEMQYQNCEYTTKKSSDLKRHMKTHEKVRPQKRPRLDETDEEIQNVVGTTLTKIVDKVSNREETALQQRFKSVELEAYGADPLKYLSDVESKIKDYVEYELEVKTGIKLQLLLIAQMYKPVEPETTTIGEFRSQQMAIYRGTYYDVSELFPKIRRAVDQFTNQGSGWAIEKLLTLEVHMVTCKPFRGSTYQPLPRKLANKEAMINVQNTDEKCFIWSILAQLHPVPGREHPNRVTKYQPFENELNMQGIDYPVALNQIQKFERQNPLAVNVYGYDDEDGLHPLRISKVMDQVFVHLMLYDGHYSLIKDLNRLLHDQTRHGHRLFFCPMCLIHRSSQTLLDEHLELCIRQEPTKTVMPEDPELKFSNTQRCLRQPLVVYADFECTTERLDPPDRRQNTEPYQKHRPCGYGMVQAHSCCRDTEFKGLEVECCQNPVERFLQSLMTVVLDYHNTPGKAMKDFDPQRHAGNICHICKETIEEGKVRDHCHICGKYRGPAHNECNQNLRLNKDVVVVFHNLRRYDGHLIMRDIGKMANLHGFELSIVAKAMEDYMSFSLVHKKEYDGRGGVRDFKYRIRFIDSLQFLNNSLDGLVKNMDNAEFLSLRKHFEEEEAIRLALRKGVYPYDYMDSFKRFDEEQLPSKDDFYSRLNDDNISDEDYQHAQAVWNFFEIENMGQYHNFYLTTDVLLLADVFERFRKSSLEQYGLDPAHYMTAPSLAWDACLKKTGVVLELVQDPEMYLFCESGIRGGISMISHRRAKANNKYMTRMDRSEKSSYIIYLDANNLYGWAMVQKLPVNGFKWVDVETWSLEDWKTVNVDGDKGYFVEVDLDYPEVLHDRHNDYPLAPETMEITTLSPWCRRLREAMRLKTTPTKKLVPNLHHKKKYIVHLKTLQFYIRQGMELKKVHRALEFNQRAWMEEYIMFNTRMRTQATNAFEKDRLKLMNNAVFGKTMENVRKYKNIEAVTTPVRFEKLAANPRYRYSCRFTEELVGVASLKPSTCLNKPIYCGFSVLELSKLLMYEFHYEYILPKYRDQGKMVKLLFTDTDSLCYWVETDDIFADMKEDADLFDFSDYPAEHPCHSTVNKKVIGKMKDEAESKIIEDFVGLRAKMYSIWGPEVIKKRAKGIKRGVVKKNITHEDYVNTVEGENQMQHQMNLIRSERHEMFTATITKKSLSPYDDKRWLLDAVNSRAHGHCRNALDAE